MNELVINNGKRVTATSLVVADKFGRNHGHVLRAIRNLECSEEFSRSNFTPSTFKDSRGKSQPMYEMTRDGFSFLAMGFTGKEAGIWKEMFIKQFNSMETFIADELLNRRLMHQNQEWIESRNNGKAMRRLTTDTIKAYVCYSKSQGSKSADLYYVNLSKLLNSKLFIWEGKKPVALRDCLNVDQLTNLRTAEQMVTKVLDESIKGQIAYKEIYKKVKTSVETFAGLIGQSVIGAKALIDRTEQQKLTLIEGAPI